MSNDKLTHYKTGIENIDKEHIELFKITSEIEKGIRNSSDVTGLLELYKTKLKEHFLSEETYMLSIEYPYFLYHKEKHLSLLKKLETIMSLTVNCEKYNHILECYIVKELDSIFLQHVDSMDLQIAEFVKNKK